LTKPVVWTIAGSDSGGGAGIQADIKTINQLGAYAASVITALTAQNTLDVLSITAVDSIMLTDQLEALKIDLPAQAIKLGMLYSAEVSEIVVRYLTGKYVVCDPVMFATSGDTLMKPRLIKALKKHIVPASSLITPNLDEAHALTGSDIKEYKGLKESARDEYVIVLARKLLKLGCRAALIKGAGDEEYSQDYWDDGKTGAWLTSPRQDTRNTHGTGCTLSAAIASAVALGYEELDAIVIAKAYVNQGMRLAPNLGAGQGPMLHAGWPESEQDLPWVTATAEAGRNRPQFPDCGPTKLGFYPIVDDVSWLHKVLPLGVNTVQLRIKQASTAELENQIEEAVSLSKPFNCRLFINDHWQLAIEKGAYGVHLGQEDLATANIDAIQKSNIRLGVSSHCYSEVARALALRPSYIAIGPIHETTSKEVSFAPQGVAALERWRKSLNYPLVAIGGITLENAAHVISAGADGIAVIRDISEAEDLPDRICRWQKLTNQESTGLLEGTYPSEILPARR
jgi:hydroxymethylpyrimidine kinase / phosphomethylpyrimidine kinase / thiamine-phosphate diphosphorylase